MCAVRAKAMLDYEAGASWGDAAAQLGLGKTAFYSLVKRWGKDRSLQSLLPKRSGPKIRITEETRARLYDDALEVARAFPDWSRKKMIEYLQTRLPAAPSRATLGPIIDKARLGVEREGLSFGQRIVVADSPAVMPLQNVDRDGEDRNVIRHVVAIVDLASTMVLGLGVARDVRTARNDAFDEAFETLDRLASGGATDGPVTFEVNLHDGDTVDAMELTRELVLSPFQIEPRADTARVNPNRLAGLLGQLDGIQFQSRATSNHDHEDDDELTGLMDQRLRDQLKLLSGSGSANREVSISLQTVRDGLTFIRDTI